MVDWQSNAEILHDGGVCLLSICLIVADRRELDRCFLEVHALPSRALYARSLHVQSFL